MSWALAAGSGVDPVFADLQARASQPLGKGVTGMGRPHPQHASWPQGPRRRGQARTAVQPVIAGPCQAIGTVVDVEQDGVPAAAGRTQTLGDISHMHHNPRIRQRVSCQMAKYGLIPLHDRRQQLCHDHNGTLWQTLQSSGQGMSKPEATHQHPRVRAIRQRWPHQLGQRPL